MGRNIADIERAIGVPDWVEIRRNNGNGHATSTAGDDMDEAIRLSRKLEASGMISTVRQRADSEARAQAAEADLHLQEVEIKRQKLELEQLEIAERLAEIRRARNGGSDQTSAILQHILTTMAEEKKTAGEQAAGLQATLMQTLHEQVAGLRQELAARVNGANEATPRRTIGEELAEIKNAYEAVWGTPAPVNAGAGLATSIDDLIKLSQVQEAHEVRMQEIRRENMLLERKMGLEDRRIEEDSRRGKVLTDTLKNVIPTVQNLAETAGSRFFGGPQQQAAPAPSNGAAIPHDAKLTACPQCSQFLAFPEGYEVVTCPQCNTTLQYHDQVATPYQAPADVTA